MTLAVLAMGCGPTLVWERPGTTEAEFRRDAVDCRREASVVKLVPTVRHPSPGLAGDTIELATVTAFHPELYRECLEARGYRQVPEAAP